MGKSFYTFIVVPNASSRLRKLKLPVRALYVLGVIVVLSFFVAVGLGFSYAKMAFKAADYDISRHEVLLACWHAGMYGTPRFRQRWRTWAAGIAPKLAGLEPFDSATEPGPPDRNGEG